MTFFWARTSHLSSHQNLSPTPSKELRVVALLATIEKTFRQAPELHRRQSALVKLNWPPASTILSISKKFMKPYLQQVPAPSCLPFLPSPPPSPGLSLTRALSSDPCPRFASLQPFPQTWLLFLGSTPMAREGGG